MVFIYSHLFTDILKEAQEKKDILWLDKHLCCYLFVLHRHWSRKGNNANTKLNCKKYDREGEREFIRDWSFNPSTGLSTQACSQQTQTSFTLPVYRSCTHFLSLVLSLKASWCQWWTAQCTIIRASWILYTNYTLWVCTCVHLVEDQIHTNTHTGHFW